jgi:hypothetical protein
VSGDFTFVTSGVRKPSQEGTFTGAEFAKMDKSGIRDNGQKVMMRRGAVLIGNDPGRLLP